MILIRWIIGILLCIATLGALSTNNYWSAFILLVLALFCLPFIKQKEMEPPPEQDLGIPLENDHQIQANPEPNITTEQPIPESERNFNPEHNPELIKETIVPPPQKPMENPTAEETFLSDYGEEWSEYIQQKGLRKPALIFIQHIELAYSALHPDEKKKLMFSFLHFNSETVNIGTDIGVNLDIQFNFTPLFDELSRLMENNSCTHKTTALVFQNCIRKKEEETIIDISDQEQKIPEDASLQPSSNVETSHLNTDNLISKAIQHLQEPTQQPSSPLRVVHSNPSLVQQHYTEEAYHLGSKYKKLLNLTHEEVTWLNMIWYPNNVFLSIEGACITTIKLFLQIMHQLKTELITHHSSLEKEVEKISKAYASFGWGYHDSVYLKQKAGADIYGTIFKRCEKACREAFQHKRQISGNYVYSLQTIVDLFEQGIGNRVNHLLNDLASTISLPDEQTEIGLNAENVNRWKITFEKLTASFNPSDVNHFVTAIHDLGKKNSKNPSLENIYFEASKFLAKHHQVKSLELYVHYLYHDLKSQKFDDKKHTKTIQKALFKTNEQLHDFEVLVSNLIKSRNLEEALAAVPPIYQPKRRKIKLDDTAITMVQQEDKAAVTLLNQYLNDELETDQLTIQSHQISPDQVEIQITQKGEEPQQNGFLKSLNLTGVQVNALNLFASSQLIIAQDQLETWCTAQSIFRNQLIDGLNEACYEVLDDVLIEEDGTNYTIYQNHYQKIIEE
jgi:hypothetical protein